VAVGRLAGEEAEHAAVKLGGFTLGRLARFHDIKSPLFYAACPHGNATGWLASAYILGCDYLRELSGLTVAETIRAAGKWAEKELGGDFGWVPQFAEGIKARWTELISLDPADIENNPSNPPDSSDSKNP
jgi:hypothetical protein